MTTTLQLTPCTLLALLLLPSCGPIAEPLCLGLAEVSCRNGRELVLDPAWSPDEVAVLTSAAQAWEAALGIELEVEVGVPANLRRSRYWRGEDPPEDGIVIFANAVALCPETLHQVALHEIGHWLGIEHVEGGIMAARLVRHEITEADVAAWKCE